MSSPVIRVVSDVTGVAGFAAIAFDDFGLKRLLLAASAYPRLPPSNLVDCRNRLTCGRQ